MWIYIETQYTLGIRILDQWMIKKLSALKQTRIHDRTIGLDSHQTSDRQMYQGIDYDTIAALSDTLD